MFLPLPFLHRLQIPEVFNKALTQVGITKELGETYSAFDILMTLLLGFFLKCPSLEKIRTTLSGHSYGVWIGKKSLPCVTTIKKRLPELAREDFINSMKQLFAQSAAEAGVVDLGVVYLDSHLVVYHGRHNLPKGYSTIRRLAIKGVYHHFAGDRRGRPILFFLTNASLRLRQTLPMLIKDIQELRKKYDNNRPLFIIFDREVYDGKLFTSLDEQKIVFLTYLKGAKKYPEEKFTETITVEFRTKISKFELYNTYSEVTHYHNRVKTLVIREPESGKQVPIITNVDRIKFQGRRIRPHNETLVEYMLNRWGQENFFKRAVGEININHSFGYSIQESSPQPEIDNPRIVALKATVEKLNKPLKKLEAKIASHLLGKNTDISVEKRIAKEPKLAKVIHKRDVLRQEISACKKQIEDLPEKVIYSDAFPSNPRKECLLEKKDLLDTLKIMAFLTLSLMEEQFQRCHRNKRTLISSLDQLLLQPTNLIHTENQWLACIDGFHLPSIQTTAEIFCHNLNLRKIKHSVTLMPIHLEVKRVTVNVK